MTIPAIAPPDSFFFGSEPGSGVAGLVVGLLVVLDEEAPGEAEDEAMEDEVKGSKPIRT